MPDKIFEILDDMGNVVAAEMDLSTALLMIKAWVNEYYMENVKLTLRELKRFSDDSAENVGYLEEK